MRGIAFALAVLATTVSLNAARADDGVVAYVDGRAVKSFQVFQAGVKFSQRLKNAPYAAQTAFLHGQVVDVAILSDAARREGYAPASVEADRDYEADSEAAAVMIRKLASDSKPDEAAVRTAYEKLEPAPEYRARHILVPSKEAATEVLARVQNGEDFAEIAKAASLDKESGAQGGELGWFAKDRMVPEFGTASAALSPGRFSDPVETRYGWHVIQLQEVRPGTRPPFEMEAPRVRQEIVQRAIGEKIAALRSAADVRWVVQKPAGW
jgi:peptidyl-prolyl cis-trans isomerase C